MNIDGQDIITALKNQRNSALDELAHAFAIIEAQKHEIEELKKLTQCASEQSQT